MKLKWICGAITIVSLLAMAALKVSEAANSFYNASGAPAQGATLSSSVMRTEFANIGAGFDKMPTLTANTAVVVNGSGTALTNTVGTLALAGNFATTGSFNTTFVQQATTTLTLPAATDTLVGRASTDTLTNKSISGSSNTLTNIGNASLTNSAVTIAGHTVSLGGSTTIAVSDLTGVGAGVATFISTPSSANLAAAVTDETGSGSLVFGTSPALTTPNLGTPSAVTLTNATGLPVSTGVSGLGAGVATFLATPSSANLLSALTTKTGTGTAVFSASPTFTGTVTAPDAGTWTASGLTAAFLHSQNTVTWTTFGQLVTADGLAMTISAGGAAVQYDIVARINGVRLTDGATAWSAISDYRAKNVEGPFTDSGTIIDAVPVYRAALKTTPGTIKAMFLAHEVQAAIPYAAAGQKDAVDGNGNPIYQTIQSTDPLVPILWAEVRSLRARVAALEAR